LENTSPSGGGEYRQWYLEEQYETVKRKKSGKCAKKEERQYKGNEDKRAKIMQKGQK
jgi:hypothetical protein